MTVEAAAGIRGQRLRAGVEDAAIGAGAAHHGRIDVQRAIVPARDAGRDLHAVVVDIGAGPMLGGALEFSDVFQAMDCLASLAMTIESSDGSSAAKPIVIGRLMGFTSFNPSRLYAVN
jgi:hypothetical protein